MKNKSKILNYEVMVAYISYTGALVRAGTYPETDIDVAEARCKSYIRLVKSKKGSVNSATKEAVDPNVEITRIYPETSTSPVELSVEEKDLAAEQYSDDPYKGQGDIPKIVMDGNPTVIKIETVNINTATREELIDLKYVGKATAAKAIKSRGEKPFSGLSDLDKRVPLAAGRSWEETGVLVFDIDERNVVDYNNSVKIRDN